MPRFQITKLEQRIAPAPSPALIPSVNLQDPGVNGAEHACKGLMNNHNPHPKLDTVQLERHGCFPVKTPPPPPPPVCPPPPPPCCPC